MFLKIYFKCLHFQLVYNFASKRKINEPIHLKKTKKIYSEFFYMTILTGRIDQILKKNICSDKTDCNCEISPSSR